MGDGFGSFFDLVSLRGCEHSFHTFEVWGMGKFTASYFLHSDGQMMDRQIVSVSRSGVLGLVLVNSLLCQLDLVFG